MPGNIARVVVDVSSDKDFDYSIPADLSGSVSIGSRVSVPFGKTTKIGYVVGFTERTEAKRLRDIRSLVDPKPFIDISMLGLARWMASYYCTSVEKAIRALLPGAVRREGAGHRRPLFVSLSEDEYPSADARITPKQQSVIDALTGTEGMFLRDLLIKAGVTRAPVKTLQKKGIVTMGPHTRERQPTKHRTILPTKPLVLMPEQEGALAKVVSAVDRAIEGRAGFIPAISVDVKSTLPRADVQDHTKGRAGFTPAILVDVPPSPVALRRISVKSTLPRADVQDHAKGRAGFTPAILVDVPPSPFALRRISEKSTLPGGGGIAKSMPPGDDDIACTGNGPLTVLLYGVTGSGKTEVYMQAIDYVLSLGHGAIVLVPEISLTPQTVERFAGRFGDRIAVLHSHLSDGERHDEWHRILDGRADVVVGARSAVFAPVRNLGLIVVDEEHEHSYKQEDAPRYNARDVAVMRAEMTGCAVVLGSATPALESWHNARTGKYDLAILPKRADNKKMPAVRIVDMRVEKERQGHVSVFSQDLLSAIGLRLERAEQTILFLNRRGFATSLICPSCGYVAGCDQCSVSYTYHRTDDILRCHICGGSRTVPSGCPECKDPSFKFAGIGTQRVERIVAKCFQHARIQRMDADETTRKDSYERILGDFRTGKTDILIGTQMIAKGLHFPNVTLVGVVYADLSLHLPDFRAGERTFQLLAQVAGRAGRGETPGEVIIQTYTPFHAAVQAVRRLDYEGLCDQELEFRKELGYPPFAHLVCITLRGPSEEKTSFCAATLARRIKKSMSEKVYMSDPTPAPLARAKGMYRYQLMMRCASTKAMTDPIKQALSDLTFPAKVTVSVDVDALSLL